ncbi:acetyl-CoA carboxylase biotin carboxylase subunit family protein [Leifsonia sp. EB34]|uniref:ATP-grasp domain-containing protein n=1 Tax=Leifsonia sp. EB34 TaxID=3156303 RepID=UPI0035168D2C
MQQAILLVYGKGGSALEYMLPRLVTGSLVDVLLVGEPRPWQRELLQRLCRTVHTAAEDVPLVDEIIAVARRLGSDGVLTFSEFCVVPTAQACTALGLPGPGDGAARSRNKLLMREAWEAAGVPNPLFRAVDSLYDLQAARSDVPGPVIVKSALGAGSISQVVVDITDDVEEAWAQLIEAQSSALSAGMVDSGQWSGPAFILEELITSSTDGWYDEPGYGDYLSVEGLVVGGIYHPIAITARLPTIPVFVELSNHAPTVLPVHKQHLILEVARRAVDALGLDTCATHTELKLKADGTVCLLESAARAGGAMVAREILEVYGVDIIRLQQDAALRRPVILAEKMLTSSDANGAAASLSVIAADAYGNPWKTSPPFVPRDVDWSELVSPGTTVEVVEGQSLDHGVPMPLYHPNSGVLGYGGLLFVRAADALTLRDDCYRILDGLEESLMKAARRSLALDKHID